MRCQLAALLAVALTGCIGSSEPVDEVEQPLVGDGLCASLDQIDDACPAHADYRNHGKYVSCVAHYLDRRVARGDLTEEQKGALQSLAARSDVGKVPGADGPSFAEALGDADGDGVADACAAQPPASAPVRAGAPSSSGGGIPILEQ